jgi:hypothetical protein
MTWGSFFKPRDVSGRESRTLFFVGVSILIMWGRFMLGGLSVSWGPINFEVASTPMVDFGAALAMVIAVWVGREWVRTTKGKTDA